MKQQARILPRLDSLYNQKKSYEVHKKKIQTIKNSRSLSKKSLSISKINQNQQDTKSMKSLIYQHLDSHQNSVQNLLAKQGLFKKNMQTIQEKKPGLSYWLKKMNPHQKRLKQEQIKENKRIRQKIKNTSSFIVQKNQLVNHQQHYLGMKSMISRFSIDQNTRKTKLRCQIVLKKISEIEKQKLRLQQSRLMSYEKVKSPKSQQKKQQKKQNPTIEKRNRNSSFLTKISKASSHKQKVLGKQKIKKQSSVSVKENIKTRLNQTSLTRVPKQVSLVKQNKMKTTTELNKKEFPNIIKSSQRYTRVKTQLFQKFSANRAFNSSKLSNLSQNNSSSIINLGDYKMVRVNFNKKQPISLKRVPSLQKESFEKPRNTSMTMKNQIELKKYVSNRIKTENSSFGKLMSKSGGVNKFDFQKKRVERFLKSRTSLSTKQLANQNQNIIKQMMQKNKQQNSEINVQAKKQNQRISIIEQKNESKKETIEVQKQEVLIKNELIELKNEDKINLDDKQVGCFATEIQ